MRERWHYALARRPRDRRPKVGGIAAHIGARVAGHATPGQVLASNTLKDLVAVSELRFTDRGMHTLEGIPGEWRLFAAAPD